MLHKLYYEEEIEEENFEEEEEEDSGPIYDTDGEGEFCERIYFFFPFWFWNFVARFCY